MNDNLQPRADTGVEAAAAAATPSSSSGLGKRAASGHTRWG